ncbi:MBL fold metallo-hydrolase [Clostridium pasteurianum]|uniref:Metal-dependent hydrolase, beta-lactamase superfamily I n=1 Tax=Clostridium pasteurianum BC1 TaxID=86416 RepID=R4K6Q3_CLOPA|nr:MBL fold metallo-hydrolase [Clostridium pasteurianum]AGK97376.1 metal-dependent hydrolase, beta-lactamase superfamily I [Clostridium pasteurianum BC1]
MKLKVLGSSSSGNCYLLQAKEETLILECGIRYKEILQGLNYKIDNVNSCLITHSHKDHSKAIKDIIKAGIDIYTSKGTIDACEVSGHRVHIIKSEQQFKLGEFTILPFATEHDAAEPLGFLIYHPEMGTMLFATDTYYIQYKFLRLSHILIECNYDGEIMTSNIDNGTLNVGLALRLAKSHMSLDNCKTLLKATDLEDVRNIVLIHLSSLNSDSELFKTDIEKLTGKPTYVAESGLEIDLESEFDG